MNDATIRPTTTLDAKQISILSGQLGDFVSETDISHRLEHQGNQQETFVAEMDDKIIGWINVFVRLEILSGIQARVGGLVVDEAIRGKGIGRSLMNAAEDWAKKMDSKTLKLNTRTERGGAHIFYQKIGYEKAKVQTSFKKKL